MKVQAVTWEADKIDRNEKGEGSKRKKKREGPKAFAYELHSLFHNKQSNYLLTVHNSSAFPLISAEGLQLLCCHCTEAEKEAQQQSKLTEEETLHHSLRQTGKGPRAKLPNVERDEKRDREQRSRAGS
ncbi:hypothetical protein WR25_00749 [Diploscapter pachys]|uniref:Uncharacterized protein n=1 Tax=Diploscapter pachys TaxID=2018661 RepID=A0A2A2LEJ9_9BILA|nr:hypothetical protein WR25_00749 [Diploscapter pachys]